MINDMRRAIGPLLATALVANGCAGQGSATQSPSETPTMAPSASVACSGQELDGTYHREISSADTSNSDLFGSWSLEIADCQFTISVDGSVQGGGRIDLVEGTAESGRIALREDVCPNEFSGAGIYDVALQDDRLEIEESIEASDQCEGRAEAFVTPPGWTRS